MVNDEDEAEHYNTLFAGLETVEAQVAQALAA